MAQSLSHKTSPLSATFKRIVYELLTLLQTPLMVIGRIVDLLARYLCASILRPEAPRQAFAALVDPLFLHGSLIVFAADFGIIEFDPHQIVLIPSNDG